MKKTNPSLHEFKERTRRYITKKKEENNLKNSLIEKHIDNFLNYSGKTWVIDHYQAYCKECKNHGIEPIKYQNFFEIAKSSFLY